MVRLHENHMPIMLLNGSNGDVEQIREKVPPHFTIIGLGGGDYVLKRM